MARFTSATDETMIGYWNDGEGAISWLSEVEQELRDRGYVTRGEDGRPCDPKKEA